jgi:ABC-type sugar transport system substrate-binding protein
MSHIKKGILMLMLVGVLALTGMQALNTIIPTSAMAANQNGYSFTFVVSGGEDNPFWGIIVKGAKDAAK